MKGFRRRVVHALDTLGVKQPVKDGLNQILEVGGLPRIGEPRVFQDLERLVAGPRPRPEASRGRILIFTMRGWTTHVAIEGLLGEALAQRGVEPVYFSCGGPLPLCGLNSFRAADPTPCADCHSYVSRFFDTLGFPTVALNELLSAEDREAARRQVESLSEEELPEFADDGIPLGRLIQTSVRWFLLRGTPGTGERWVRALRGFLEASLLIRVAAERLLDRTRPDRILCLGGLFFAERVLMEVARRRGVPVTTYERGFMANTWVFRNDDIAPDYWIGDDFRRIADQPLSQEEADRVERYLRERSSGRADSSLYWPRIRKDRETLIDRLGLDPRKSVVTLFSNITWDSGTQDKDLAFRDLFDWLESSIRELGERDDTQLVLRVHPAEVRLAGLETTERVVDTLEARMGAIPESVKVVPSESDLSSYTLGQMSRLVSVYTSTLGLEMACEGVPVVVAGNTHYRGLGFTIDVESREEYGSLLDRLLCDAPPIDSERARRYAHFLFFRYMVPLEILTEDEQHRVRVPLESFAELAPGRMPALDAVMRGLLEGAPIYDDVPPELLRGYACPE